MTQDLHPTGAVGDATLATRGQGRSGAAARRASLRRTAARGRPFRSCAVARRAARSSVATFHSIVKQPRKNVGKGPLTARLRGGRGAGLDALSATTTKRRVRRPLPTMLRMVPPLPLRAGRTQAIVLAARLRVRALLQASNDLPKAGMQRREAPKSWPRHAGECCHSLALRARRAPQDNPLARAACFGRAAPPGAPPRFLA